MLQAIIKEDLGMPAIVDSFRGSLKFFCVALVPLFAACGGGGGGGAPAPGGGGAAAVACGTATPVAFQPAPGPDTPPNITLSLQTLNTQLNFPIFVTAAPGRPDQLFVVERFGLIKVLDRTSGAVIGTFLDVSGELAPIQEGDERGLHSMAFDPGYATNGRFYVSYIGINDNAIVARYLVSGSPATSNVAVSTADSIILSTSYQGSGTLFGGQVTFGRDGFLYVGRGSSGSNSGPNAENVGVVLGKMLRINVNGDDFPSDATRNYAIPPDNPCVGQAGAQPEIWSIGLRNPWRFSFDRQTGDLYIADVGGSAFEEINVSTGANAARGINFGWRNMEGTHCHAEEPQCDVTGLQLPVLDYAHNPDPNCNSVAGGYVYRGSAIAGLQGTYFYADTCEGFVRSFQLGTNAVTAHTTRFTDVGFITSFGEDSQGELYITTAEGALFRIQP
jgi:glucose/arabinose dehydrogenase